MLTNNIGIAQDLPKSSTEVPIALPAPEKTILDSLPNIETPQVQKDSINTDSIAKPKGVLEGIVDYKAKDYTSVNQKTKQIFLYNEAEVQYQDMDIKSGVIIIDYGKDLVYAGRLKDSLGNYSQAPVFKHPCMQKKLVNRREFIGEHLIKIIDYLFVTLHCFPPNQLH